MTDYSSLVSAALASANTIAPPASTYRVQFHKGFTFADAARIVPYLHRLGITHLYASPYLKAAPGSTHGYDVVNHSQLNPELGTRADFDALASALREHGMAQVLDIVPNHVGISGGHNPWWNDVLRLGRASVYSDYFDIRWGETDDADNAAAAVEAAAVDARAAGGVLSVTNPSTAADSAAATPAAAAKVLLPVLGEPIGRVIDAGQLRVAVGEGAFELRYFDNAFPVAAETFDLIIGLPAGSWSAATKSVTGASGSDGSGSGSDGSGSDGDGSGDGVGSDGGGRDGDGGDGGGTDGDGGGGGDGGPELAVLREIAQMARATRRMPVQSSVARAARRAAVGALTDRVRTLLSDPVARPAVDAAVARINGGVPHKGDDNPARYDALDRLASAQHYRLAFWRVAPHEINYRRFFDINTLAGLAVEREKVFDDTHRLVFDLMTHGIVTGLRVDHPDGLRDPKAYFIRLQQAFVLAMARQAAASLQLPLPAGQTWDDARPAIAEAIARATTPAGIIDPATGQPSWPLWVVAEKILAPGEALPPDWPVAGTTGYDFLNEVNGLFIDPAGEGPLTELYANWIGHATDIHQATYDAKRTMLRTSFAAELSELTRLLKPLADAGRRTRDLPAAVLAEALAALIASFGVYRTYITPDQQTATDAKRLDDALAAARQHTAGGDPMLPGAFDCIRSVLLDPANPARDAKRESAHTTTLPADKGHLQQTTQTTTQQKTQPTTQQETQPTTQTNTREQTKDAQPSYPWRTFVARFQQLTSPVTAKGVEDTLFYRHFRLAGLNEVGAEPDAFGQSPAALHRYLEGRRQATPLAMSALSTHDTKRSEDVRARLNLLSELPADWSAAVRGWRDINAQLRGLADGGSEAAEAAVAEPADVSPTDIKSAATASAAAPSGSKPAAFARSTVTPSEVAGVFAGSTPAAPPPAPSPNDEYLIYQSLLGVWPLELIDGIDGIDRIDGAGGATHAKGTGNASRDELLGDLTDRLVAYTLKAIREAKTHTTWTEPSAAYEAGCEQFIRRMLAGSRGSAFVSAFLPFVGRVARLGLINSLAQTTLRLTAPGIPDTYQGSEWWDLSLVDPDNRRPVDYARLGADLANIDAEDGLAADGSSAPSLGLSGPKPAACDAKLRLTSRLLRLRRDRPGLFCDGDYRPLAATDATHPNNGPSGNLFAFARRGGGGELVVVVPRLISRLLPGPAPALLPGRDAWGETSIDLSDGSGTGSATNVRVWTNVITGESVPPGRAAVADLLGAFPVGVWVRDV